MIRHAKYFDSNNTMYFKVSDKKLFKNYAKIWEKISSLIGEEFDSESVYGDNDKYMNIKAKIRHATPAVTLFLILPMLLMWHCITQWSSGNAQCYLRDVIPC